MRADRLLSIMMLLQNRGKLTADYLARELEVSVRTIYRDMDALSASGVPVYCERGPGGGCALMDNYRTHLTGLNTNELQALFAMSIPAPLAQLGVAGPLKAALRKLEAAMPMETDSNRASQRILIDWKGWQDITEQVPHLHTCYDAVWQDRKLDIRYQGYAGNQTINCTVDPYALAAKGGAWYLIGRVEQSMRVFQLSRLLNAQQLKTTFTRAMAFDLDSFWSRWCEGRNIYRKGFRVQARVAPELATLLVSATGLQLEHGIEHAGEPDAHGWREMELAFDSFEAARSYLLGFGAAVEVLSPKALRLSILDFAEQITHFYAGE